jgi:insertion element IS1 protein InsB
MIDRLLLERIPLAGIARVMQVSENWLQMYVKRCYQAISQRVRVRPKPKGSVSVQMDKLWSFVDHKGNKQWVWLTLDVLTPEILGCFIADRSQQSAQGLWDSLPLLYRQCAVLYTDDWDAYACTLPQKLIGLSLKRLD